MKSIQIKRYGSSDVMEVNNTASVSNPSRGKILVSVKAHDFKSSNVTIALISIDDSL